MKRTLVLICTALAAGSCQRSGDSESSSTSKDMPGSTSSSNPTTTTLSNRPAESRPAAAPSALNGPAFALEERAVDTALDELDRSGVPAPSDERATSDAERRITQEIHQALLDDPSLAAAAKDIEINMKDGVVTLRGPVRSRQQKAQVAAAAQRVSGITRIDNRLDIIGP